MCDSSLVGGPKLSSPLMVDDDGIDNCRGAANLQEQHHHWRHLEVQKYELFSRHSLCVHAHRCHCVRVHVHACVCVFVCVLHTCMHVCVCVFVCVLHTCMHVCVFVCVFII